MNDNITTINPDQRTLIAYSDYMVILPPFEEDAHGDLIVKGTDIADDQSHVNIRFGSTAQRTMAEQIKLSPPKTVGQLWRRYLSSAHAYATNQSSREALERALERINQEMNEYADDNNFCESYEQALSSFNTALQAEGYKGYFTFTGRKSEREVTVRRQRVVIEETTFTMELGYNEEPDWADAVDIASESYDWHVIDEEWDTDNYEITNID